METLIIPGSDKIDVRNKEEVSMDGEGLDEL